METLKREIDSELAKKSLYEFLKQAWPIIEPAFPLIETWHLRALCEVLEAVARSEIRRLLINIPPGHGKSNLVSVCFPAWRWVLDPSWRVLCASYEANLTKRDSIRTANVIKSEWYQDSFIPKRDGWSIVKDTEDWVINTASGYRLATSVGGKGTGWRADTILIDDPLNSLDARSEAARAEARYWLDKAISSRLKNPKTGQIVMIMQRLHQDDPAGHVLRQGGYEHFCLPSEYDAKRKSVVFVQRKLGSVAGGVSGAVEGAREKLWEDPRTEQGELLFPALYSTEVIQEAKRVMGSDGYAGQHQQRPTPQEGGLFKKGHWRFWKPDGVASLSDFRPEGCTKIPATPLPALETQIVSLDAAFKDGKKNDYVVFLVVGVYKANRYVLDVYRGKMSFTKTLVSFRDIVSKWPKAMKKLVEDKANGSAIIDTLRSEISGIVPIEPEGGKEARAAAIQPSVESGNVYLQDGASWLDDFVQEFADFPNGTHDDQVDALSQALIYLRATPAMARAINMVKL
jgi:predicted phage terminase large subunit-like protein